MYRALLEVMVPCPTTGTDEQGKLDLVTIGSKAGYTRTVLWDEMLSIICNSRKFQPSSRGGLNFWGTVAYLVVFPLTPVETFEKK